MSDYLWNLNFRKFWFGAKLSRNRLAEATKHVLFLSTHRHRSREMRLNGKKMHKEHLCGIVSSNLTIEWNIARGKYLLFSVYIDSTRKCNELISWWYSDVMLNAGAYVEKKNKQLKSWVPRGLFFLQGTHSLFNFF